VLVLAKALAGIIISNGLLTGRDCTTQATVKEVRVIHEVGNVSVTFTD